MTILIQPSAEAKRNSWSGRHIAPAWPPYPSATKTRSTGCWWLRHWLKGSRSSVGTLCWTLTRSNGF